MLIESARRHAGKRVIERLFTVWSDTDRFLRALPGEGPAPETPGHPEEAAATLRACVSSVARNRTAA